MSHPYAANKFGPGRTSLALNFCYPTKYNDTGSPCNLLTPPVVHGKYWLGMDKQCQLQVRRLQVLLRIRSKPISLLDLGEDHAGSPLTPHAPLDDSGRSRLNCSEPCIPTWHSSQFSPYPGVVLPGSEDFAQNEHTPGYIYFGVRVSPRGPLFDGTSKDR